MKVVVNLRWSLVAAASAISFMIPAPSQADNGRLGSYSETIPEEAVFCPLAGSERSLREALEGRPLVIFLTDAHYGFANPLGRRLADAQAEFGPWFSWAGVVVGAVSRQDVAAMRQRSTIHFEHCFHDRQGQWWRDLGIGALPAVVVANEDGYVLGRFSGAGRVADAPELPPLLERVAQAGNLRGKAVRDFRLRDARSGLFRTLFDVARKDYTLILLLQTSSPSSQNELRLLDRLRDRHVDRLGLTAIFVDPGGAAAVRGHLQGSGAKPDHVLLDPEALYPRSYYFEHLPVLLLAGPEGRIVFSRKGYSDGEAPSLASTLESILLEPPPPPRRRPFQESRRISDEAREFMSEGNARMAALFWERAFELYPEAFTLRSRIADTLLLLGREHEAAREYAHYLSSGRGAYDHAEIRARIRTFLDGPP